MAFTLYTPQNPEGLAYDDSWVHRWNDDHRELFNHEAGTIITFSEHGWYSIEEETHTGVGGAASFRTEGRF